MREQAVIISIYSESLTILYLGFKKGMVINMSYIAPAVRDRFESLSIDLKNVILERNVTINTIHDLIRVLEDIVSEDKAGN